MTSKSSSRWRTVLLALAGLGTLAGAAWVSRRLFEGPDTSVGTARVAEQAARGHRAQPAGNPRQSARSTSCR